MAHCFIARVELPDRRMDHPHYAVLHVAMKEAHFEATINCRDDAAYHLPHATYFSERYENTVAAADAALVAAKRAIQVPAWRYSNSLTGSVED